MTNRHLAPRMPVWLFAVAVAQLASPALAWQITTTKASTSRQARDEAIRSIPFGELTDEMQQRLREIVTNPTIHRCLPTQTIHCDPEMYVFLVRHPEVIVDTWKIMGITKLTLTRTGKLTAKVEDGFGTHSDVELVYGTPEIHVIYADGTYDGPLFLKKFTGRSVVVLKSWYSLGADQRPVVTNQVDIFLQLDSVGAEVLAKTLHPLFGKSVDHNFAQAVDFMSRLCQAAEGNGPGVQRLADQLPTTTAEVRQQFANLAAAVSHRAALRDNPVDDNPAPPLGSRRTTARRTE